MRAFPLVILAACASGKVHFGTDTVKADDTDTAADSGGPDTGETGPEETASDSRADTGETGMDTDTDTDTEAESGAETAESGADSDTTSESGTGDSDTSVPCTPGLSMVATAVEIDPATTAWPVLVGCSATGIHVTVPAWLYDPALASELDGSVEVRIQSQPGYNAHLEGTMTFTSDQNTIELNVTLEPS